MNELEFETTNRIRRRLGLTALIAATNSLKAVRFIVAVFAVVVKEDVLASELAGDDPPATAEHLIGRLKG